MKRQRCSRGGGVVGLVVMVLGVTAGPSRAAEPAGVHRLEVVVQESAGIRRFGYPVTVILPLAEPVGDVRRFRLLEKGKPVVAQFRPHGDTRQGIHKVSLDFNASHAPRETRTYVVEYGPKVEPGPTPSRGMKVVVEDDQFRVVHSPALQFVVPRNLLGLLRGVKTAATDYLRPDSAGLLIRYKDDILFRAGGLGSFGEPTVARIVKQGPLASTLRFETTEALRGGRSVASAVTLDFPLSKSWVKVTWTVDDPQGLVAGLGADLNLHVRGELALVDFGAGSYVYAHLGKGQTALLRALEPRRKRNRKVPAWETLVGRTGALKPYVVGEETAAEGWAHVMDKERCTAVALAEFTGEKGEAEIAIDAGGRLRVWKHFVLKGQDPPAGRKTITFWLHFVSMPVQVGAVTSPQAMLAPLQVKVRHQR
jgi:hypothetical protein